LDAWGDGRGEDETSFGIGLIFLDCCCFVAVVVSRVLVVVSLVSLMFLTETTRHRDDAFLAETTRKLALTGWGVIL
jgi:hypothetical protein